MRLHFEFNLPVLFPPRSGFVQQSLQLGRAKSRAPFKLIVRELTMSPDELNWFESTIESVEVNGRDLVVVGSNIGVPGRDPIRARVTFHGVASAKRQVIEYIGDPKGNPSFKPPYIVNELPEIDLPGVSAFGLEGVSTFEPAAWLDIDIQAQGGTVEVL